ncbi:MAG: hypothetical protein H0X67_16035, partial [Acidobacteria bacterium]|nr:hypothetical protein [Acidobacteriota bacterium]
AAKGKMDVRHHGWFVFFAPRDNPEIAGVIFAEHAGGSGFSLPIAKHAIETYFAKKEGLPLPVIEKPVTAPVVIADVAPATAPVAPPRSGGNP